MTDERHDPVAASAVSLPARRTYRALLHAFLLMDFRSQQFGRATNTGPNALITPLFWVVGQYILIGIAISIMLFLRVNAFFFATAGLAMSMLMLTTAIIVEFNEVVLDSSDLEVLGHLPVQLRAYARARMTNLFAYVLLMTLAINLAPAIVGMGLTDSGWKFLPAYALAALLSNLAVAAGVILLYTVLLRASPSEKARDVLAWTQIILVFVLFYAAQLVFRDSSSRLEIFAFNPPPWLHYLPPAQLALFVDSCVDPAAAIRWIPIGICAVLTVLLGFAAVSSLAQAYARLDPIARRASGRAATLLPAPGTLMAGLSVRLVRPGVESASFWLTSTMLRRDPDLRMRCWPSIGIVLAPLCIGLVTHRLGNPSTTPPEQSALSLAALYLLAAPLPAIIFNLRFSTDHAASWILATTPLARPFELTEGIRKAILMRIMLPLLGLVTVVFAAAWRNPLAALLHGWIGLQIINASTYVSLAGLFHRVPFSQAPARGQSSGPAALWSGIITTAAVALAVVHALLAPNLLALAGLALGLTIATFFLGRLAQQVINARMGRRATA